MNCSYISSTSVYNRIQLISICNIITIILYFTFSMLSLFQNISGNILRVRNTYIIFAPNERMCAMNVFQEPNILSNTAGRCGSLQVKCPKCLADKCLYGCLSSEQVTKHEAMIPLTRTGVTFPQAARGKQAQVKPAVKLQTHARYQPRPNRTNRRYQSYRLVY